MGGEKSLTEMELRQLSFHDKAFNGERGVG
jgi:hypothetical protein